MKWIEIKQSTQNRKLQTSKTRAVIPQARKNNSTNNAIYTKNRSKRLHDSKTKNGAQVFMHCNLLGKRLFRFIIFLPFPLIFCLPLAWPIAAKQQKKLLSRNTYFYLRRSEHQHVFIQIPEGIG